MAKINGQWKIIGNDTKNGKFWWWPYGEFADAHAKYLEDIGFRKNVAKVIRPLLNVFDKVGVSLDGDCTYNNILETENLKDKIELFLT